jgi:heterodisulfide reductase subunit B2
MKNYSFFPGCSCSAGSGQAYTRSIRELAPVLELNLSELEDWNCCGSTSFSSSNEIAMVSLAARNLSLAEKKGWDIVTPCSSCFVTLNWADSVLKKNLKKHPSIKPRVDQVLSEIGLTYGGKIVVRHMLDILVNDVSHEYLAQRIQSSLKGLKVAPYYGCQVVRPHTGLDHPENPRILDRLLGRLGTEVINFPLKTACCGGSLALSDNSRTLELIRDILGSAMSAGANCIATVCPLCQLNLDMYQSRVNRKFRTNFKLPVFFFTQIMGLAMGLDSKKMGLASHIVSPQNLLSSCL